jgi:hypothetical protein
VMTTVATQRDGCRSRTMRAGSDPVPARRADGLVDSRSGASDRPSARWSARSGGGEVVVPIARSTAAGGAGALLDTGSHHNLSNPICLVIFSVLCL